MTEPQARTPGALARTVLQLAVLGVLLGASLWLVRPFLVAGVWAAMIAIATWPLLERVKSLCGGRRAPAVTVLTSVLVLLLAVPVYLGVRAVIDTAADVSSFSRSLVNWTVPQPPEWLDGVPLVGAKAAAEWRTAAAESPEQVAARVTPYADDVARWLVAEIGSLGAVLVQILLTIVITAILYSSGETAAAGVRRFARWLGGEQGERAVQLAAQAVRAVALGVIVTAILQSALVGLGLAVAGVPFAAALTVASFVLAVAQIGPIPVLIGAVIWAYANLGAGWATVFLVWAVFCSAIDNVVRPILIRRGADFPLLLIFAGVIGGLLAFGVVGLFVGPVVLGVTYTLLGDWVAAAE